MFGYARYYAGDGRCDDGGYRAHTDTPYPMCALGTDCADCGTRAYLPPPPSPPPGMCLNTCNAFQMRRYAPGVCNDGGPGDPRAGQSGYTPVCRLGRDCIDCGVRVFGVHMRSREDSTVTGYCLLIDARPARVFAPLSL